MQDAYHTYKKIFTKLFNQAQQWQNLHEQTCKYVTNFMELSNYEAIMQQAPTHAGIFASMPTTIQLIQGTYFAQLEQAQVILKNQLPLYLACAEHFFQFEKEAITYYKQNIKSMQPWFQKDEQHQIEVDHYLAQLSQIAVQFMREYHRIHEIVQHAEPSNMLEQLSLYAHVNMDQVNQIVNRALDNVSKWQASLR